MTCQAMTHHAMAAVLQMLGMKKNRLICVYWTQQKLIINDYGE